MFASGASVRNMAKFLEVRRKDVEKDPDICGIGRNKKLEIRE